MKATSWMADGMPERRGWRLGLGIAMVVLGVVALASAPVAGIVSAVLLGLALLAGGGRCPDRRLPLRQCGGSADDGHPHRHAAVHGFWPSRRSCSGAGRHHHPARHVPLPQRRGENRHRAVRPSRALGLGTPARGRQPVPRRADLCEVASERPRGGRTRCCHRADHRRRLVDRRLAGNAGPANLRTRRSTRRSRDRRRGAAEGSLRRQRITTWRS